MIVKSLLTSVTKYFSSLSVPSYMGHDKTFLIVADDNKKQTDKVMELDATTHTELTYTALPVSVPTETKKAYIDGALEQSLTLSISGSIDKTKLLDLQKMANVQNWFYILYSKDMGGTIAKKGYYSNSKLYFIKNLTISDSGFFNSVDVSINLQEVVLYSSQVEYRYGVKQTNPMLGDGTEAENKGLGDNNDDDMKTAGLYGEVEGDSFLTRTRKYAKFIANIPNELNTTPGG